MTSGSCDISQAMSVREARDQYLASKGFSVEGYSAPRFEVKLLGLRWSFPNLSSRQRIVPLHDLHHVATGYGTDLVGEAEIGAWELRAGCTVLIAWILNGLAVFIGLSIAPRRTWLAFRHARGQRTLYRAPAPYEELLDLTVVELRHRLGIPPEGLGSP